MQLFYVFKILFFCFCFCVKSVENMLILEEFYKLVMQM